jgi:hypothetical protein
MVLLISSVLVFFLISGFGISTQLYADFIGTSKKTNDLVSVFVGLFFTVIIAYIGLAS